jgi:hypothetical protein
MGNVLPPPPLRSDFDAIWENLESLKVLLEQDAPIEETTFNQLVGAFTHLLNVLLKNYPSLEDVERDAARPFILYLRQMQGYLVFLLRFPDILQVPHHSEINQALDFITRRETLIEETYVPLARQEKKLFSGQFRGHLEECLGKRQTGQS